MLTGTYVPALDNRAAGVREGARPDSQFNRPPQKSRSIQAFRAKRHFDKNKMPGG